jgi:high-affinity nickel-transport protein
MNAYILYKLILQMRKVVSLSEGEEAEAWKIEGGGILFSVLKKMFKLIDRYVKFFLESAAVSWGYE